MGGGERDRVYDSACICVRGVGGGCTAVQGMCKCVAYFGAVNLLARHVPGALFMGFYKEKCYFCLVYRQLERERDGE